MTSPATGTALWRRAKAETARYTCERGVTSRVGNVHGKLRAAMRQDSDSLNALEAAGMRRESPLAMARTMATSAESK
jgi:hypothetical protein